MRVREIMKREVRTIAPDRPLTEASETMRIRGIRHLVVLEHSKLIGVVSNRDLASITRRELDEVRVRDVMNPHPITIDIEATISQAANRMRGHKIGCLPVVSGGKLAGIITITDLLEHIGRNDRAERKPLRNRPSKGRHPAHA